VSRQKRPRDTAVRGKGPQDMEGGESAGVRGVIGAVSGEERRCVAADGIASVTANLGRQGPSPCSFINKYKCDVHR